MRTKSFLCAILAMALVPHVIAESAEHAYKAGTQAEKKNDLDSAFQAFKRAHDAKPADPKYMAAYVRLRFYSAAQHIHNGDELRDQEKLTEALAEYRLAAQIDPANFQALGEIRRTTDEIQKKSRAKELASQNQDKTDTLEADAKKVAGPVQLEFRGDQPVSIHMTAATDEIYKTVAKLGGFNVLIDPDYKPQKITFDLSNVKLSDAMTMLAIQSKTFWRPLSSNTILVSTDSTAKRKELQQSAMRTFYLQNASTPADLQEAAGTLKGILDISHIQVTPELRSLTLRGTPDQLVLAQRLLHDIDKPKSEVLIDLLVLEVSRNTLQTFGASLPTTVSTSIAPQGSSSGTSSTLTLKSLPGLGTGDIAVSIGGASFTALATDSNTKVLQRPEIRVMDSEKASLRIGDRIPIATGSFQSGLTQGVNTQFQYIDVGVNVDITPYIHAGNDVTLKMSLEISTVTGEQVIDGVTEPTIGQRRIEHEARLADGEVSLVGGILADSETHSLSGYPGLLKVPILRYLFGQDSKQRQENEIIFAIIPHVVRNNSITDENLKMVDLGAEGNVTYRKDSGTEVPESSVQPAGTLQTPNKNNSAAQRKPPAM